MKNTALITGASSGIGKEFAKIHSSNGGDCVLIARSEEALKKLQEELQSNHQNQVAVLPIDLTSPNAIESIMEFINRENISIDILINNAGFGGHGRFHERDWQQDKKMIQLNVMALTALTHAVLQQMIPRKKGQILNIASVAGFLPGPLQATYFATKAYVVSFTRGIARELQHSGITITALCPGPVHTGFEKAAGLDGGNLFKQATDAHSTALKGYNAMKKGKGLVFNQKRYQLLNRIILPLLPSSFKAMLVEKMQTK
jgi:short-subunit dehydrogenase